MPNHTLIKRSMIVGLTATAMAFPAAAQARFAEDPGGGPSASPVLTAGPQPATPASSGAPVTVQSASTFHWGDAGIGAGGAVVLVGAAGVGAAAMRRRRPQGTLAS